MYHYWRFYTNLIIFNNNTEMFVGLVNPERSLLCLLHQSDFGSYSNTTRLIFITFTNRMLICKRAAKCVQSFLFPPAQPDSDVNIIPEWKCKFWTHLRYNADTLNIEMIVGNF